MSFSLAQLDELIHDQAVVVVGLVQAVADGTVRGPRRSAVLRAQDEIEALLAWVERYDAFVPTVDNINTKV